MTHIQLRSGRKDGGYRRSTGRRVVLFGLVLLVAVSVAQPAQAKVAYGAKRHPGFLAVPTQIIAVANQISDPTLNVGTSYVGPSKHSCAVQRVIAKVVVFQYQANYVNAWSVYSKSKSRALVWRGCSIVGVGSGHRPIFGTSVTLPLNAFDYNVSITYKWRNLDTGHLLGKRSVEYNAESDYACMPAVSMCMPTTVHGYGAVFVGF